MIERKTFTFNSSHIGITQIKEFVNFYKKKLIEGIQNTFELDFQFGQIVESVDELLYAYILLFINDFSKSNINIDFVTNKPFRIAIQQISYIRIFINEETTINVTENGVIPKSFITSSKDYIPFLFINELTYGRKDKFDLFNERPIDVAFKQFIIDSKRKNKGKLESLYSSYNIKNEFLRKVKDLKTGIPKTISDLAWHFMFDTLSHLNVLRYSFTEFGGEKTNYRITNLKQDDSDNLQKEIFRTLVNNGFFKYSYVKIFLFSLLAENCEQFVIGKRISNIKSFTANYLGRISILIKQTNDIAYGLEELAKNIIEHTGKKGKNGFGVIAARIHSKKKLELLKDNHLKRWCLSNNSKEVFSFLDINVIDSGLEDVSTTYKRNLNKEIKIYSSQKDENHMLLTEQLKKDLEVIEKEKYSFSHFLNFEKIELQHQIHRANARLGLLIFSNLVISKRNGIIKIGSTNISKPKTDHAYLQLNSNNRIEVVQIEENNEFYFLGTNYNFIIPIGFMKDESTIEKDYVYSGTSTSVLNPLFNYNIYNNGEKKKQLDDGEFIVPLSYNTIPDTNKYEKVLNLSEIIEQTSFEQKNAIVLLDVEKIECVSWSSSDWLRLFACTQFLKHPIPLIILNIDILIYHQLIGICKIYDSAIKKFWNKRQPIVFYFNKEYIFQYRKKINNQHQTISIWMNSVLYGDTFIEYLTLNRSISRYHHNLYSIVEYDDKTHKNEKESIITHSKLCSSDGKLLNFELLIKQSENLTLFEESIRSMLNIEVCTLTDDYLLNEKISKEDYFFHQFKGFKLSNSHFKLGSKIHISDFYYAKRLFYNSFYSNRFSFLIAKYIKEHVLVDYNISEKFTLIGYSHYSDLLVSNTRRLLEENGFQKIINHDVVLENGKILKNAGNIKKNVILIIPISSTFSTSDKMKNWIDKILHANGFTECNPINKIDISVLLVADKSYENFNNYDKKYFAFGWEKWENNTPSNRVLIKRRNASKQKFFIPLTTEWHPIHECDLCFRDEKCLLETGANSVSPESIFGFPIVREKEVNDKISYIDYFDEEDGSSFVVQKHVKRDNKHYKQYVKTGAFLKKDRIESEKKKKKSKVVSWLEKQKDSFEYKNGKSIVIITPSKAANSGFVNLVNEYIFSDTATILQYSDADDLLQNFVKFHASFFFDSTILFVDDVLHSAKAFHFINDYIRSIPFHIEKDENNTSDFSSRNHRTVDHCFCLFNRLSYLDEKTVLNNLSQDGKISSFIELDLPPIKLPNYDFPDVIKGELFNKLAKESVTDMMKIHFHELGDHIKAYDVNTNAREPQSDLNNLFNFLIYQSLYSFFYGKFNKESEFFYNNSDIALFVKEEKIILLDLLRDYVKKDKEVRNFLESKYGSKFQNEIDTRIIYICSTPPFSYYKDIKETAFVWVDSKLKSFQKDIVSDKEFRNNLNHCKYYNHNLKREIPAVYCNYQTFKLYLRLATELKSNYLFSVEMLDAIEVLIEWIDDFDRGCKKVSYEEKSIFSKQDSTDIFNPPKVEYKLIPSEEKNIASIGFSTFYTGLVQQVIHNEEAKAVELVKNIVKITESKKISLRKTFDNSFVNLLRNLVLENTFIFDTFHSTFYKEKKHNLRNFTLESDVKNQQFNTYRNKIKDTIQSSRYQAVVEMCKKFEYKDDDILSETDPGLTEAFEKTMYLKTMLRNELTEKHGGDIKQKVNTILKYLSEIINVEEGKCGGGAFFSVRYKNLLQNSNNIKSDDLYTIGNYATPENDRIKVNITDTNSLVYEIYKGISDCGSKKRKSFFEILCTSMRNGNKYISSCIEDCDNKKINDINKGFIETQQDQFYNNMFFMRISDVKEDISHKDILLKYVEILTNQHQSKNIFKDIENDHSEAIKEDIQNILGEGNEKNLCDAIYDDFEGILHKRFEKLFTKAITNKELRLSIVNNIQKSTKKQKDIGCEERIKTVLLDAINNKVSFNTNPRALIGFYKCNINEIKENGCLCLGNEFCTKCEKGSTRLDLKRLRFILLLNDDIKAFVDHHLDNDSLRAFVEMDTRAHMFGNVDHSMSFYNEKITDLLEKSNDEFVKRHLAGLSRLYYGKFKLKHVYYLYQKNNSIIKSLKENRIFPFEYTARYLQNVLKEYLESTLYLNRREFLINKFNINVTIDEPTLFYYYLEVLDELLFEIALNISKHIKTKVQMQKDNLTDLNITISMNKKYFIFQNNLVKKRSSSIEINTQLKSNFSSRGLGFMNNITRLIDENKNKLNIYTEIEDNNFNNINDRIIKIFVPILNSKRND